MSLLWYETHQRDRCLEKFFADPFSVHSFTVTCGYNNPYFDNKTGVCRSADGDRNVKHYQFSFHWVAVQFIAPAPRRREIKKSLVLFWSKGGGVLFWGGNAICTNYVRLPKPKMYLIHKKV